MKSINIFVNEKLRINKDTEVDNLDYPVKISFWSQYPKIDILRQDIESLGKIKNFQLFDFFKTKSDVYKLYKIILNNKEDLFKFYIYLMKLHLALNDNVTIDDLKNVVKDEYLYNYEDLEDYFKQFSSREILNAL